MRGTMKRISRVNMMAAGLLILLAVDAPAQSASGTTTLSVTVPAEAALTVTTGTTSMTTASTTFGASFTGSTNVNVKFRTSATTGSGTLTVKITTDFSPAGGPSVGTPPTAGDALSYTCAITSSATCATGSTTASASAATNVLTMGAAKHSTNTGDVATVAWSLTDDPVYAQGVYTATATFTISAS